MTKADIADRAADIIETDGWTQHRSTYRGRRCLLAALGEAAAQILSPAATRRQVTVMGDLYEDIADHLDLHGHRQLGVGVVNVAGPVLVDWNDTDGRTRYEVIDALRGTAKHLRNKAKP